MSIESQVIQTNQSIISPLKTQSYLQSTSHKVYYVKKQKIINQRSKQPKDFFKLSRLELQDQIISNYSSIGSLTQSKYISEKIDSHNQSHQNNFNFKTIGSSQSSSNKPLLLISLFQSKISNNNKKQSLSSNLSFNQFQSNILKKKVLKKKYIFETICDKSFNKAFKRKQILIQTEEQDQNPELMKTIQIDEQKKLRIDLPKILKKSKCSQNYLSLDKSNSSLKNKNSCIPQIRSQLSDKFNIQKLKKYRQIWSKRTQSRLSLHKNLKKQKIDKSVIQSSFQKSVIIGKHANKDIQIRKSLQKFEDKLRNQQTNYSIVGEINVNIPSLKGRTIKYQNQILHNPNISSDFRCEQVHKIDNQRIRKQKQKK